MAIIWLVFVFICVPDGGMLWLWGANHSGQLGLEIVEIASKPHLLSLRADLR